MHEKVALMDVPYGEHMLLQNLQIVGSSNVHGEEEKTPSTVISAENTPIPGLAKFDWKVVAHWAYYNVNCNYVL